MGRHIKYRTEEEQKYARQLRNKRYYQKHRDKLNNESMRKYYERKSVEKELS